MDEFAIGATFAEHVIRGVAGRGGMGIVYRAMHLPLKREVALKVIAPGSSTDDEFRARFRNEFEAAASIQHPNVIPIYHAGEQDGLLFVTMRYIAGDDLARIVAAETRVEPVRAAMLTGQVAAALDAAHALGLVPRDVKPANILVEHVGDFEHALLTDFGLTKSLQSDMKMTKTGTVIGTFDYTAPEQLDARDVDARTDVYALGCVLFQMLTGRVPYPRDRVAATMFAHFEAKPPSVTALVPEAPPALDRVIATALAKDPARRYQSAGDLARAALSAVDRPSLASGVSRLAAGESPSGWSWPALPAIQTGSGSVPPLQSTLLSELEGGAFVGRADALERLRARYAKAQAGSRQVVLLSGEPGIGKTRLATELAREAHESGATVLYGRNDAESLVPYQPFVTAVQHYMAHREALELPPELGPELSELARLVPALRRHLPELREPIAEDGETRRYRLFEAVTRVLASVAAEAPTVLILDDLQWADTSTALLLGHMLQDIEANKLLIVGTVRESGGHRAEELTELISRLYRDPGFERIALEGLDATETRALVHAAAAREATGSFILKLQDGTEGNPFFIKETLRSLIDVMGAASELEDDTLSRVPVPEGIRELIGTRLSRLGESAAQVLTPASVVGREFRLEVLEALIDEPVERIISALEEADDAGLVREVADDADRFVFSHALVRETLYEAKSASGRVRLPHRIAQALEALGPLATPAELAHHYVESRHLDREGKAVDYCEQAATAAMEALAYEEAKAHYAAALERLHNDPERRCALLIGLGTAAARMSDPDAVGAFMDAAAIAADHGLPDLLARAAIGRFGGYAHAGMVDTEAIALLERALAAQGDQESPLVAQLMAKLANALHFTGANERVDQLSARALEIAQRGDDPSALVAALESRHTGLVHSNRLQERLRIATALSDLAQEAGEPELKLLGHHWRTWDLLEMGQVAAARVETTQLMELAERLRRPTYRHHAARWEVLWAMVEDRNEEAPALIARAYEQAKAAQAAEADVEAAGQQFALAYRLGMLGNYAELLHAEFRANPQIVVNLPAAALAQMLAGNREAGIEIFERVAADDFAVLPHDMLWLGGICVLAQTCALIGDVPRARTLYEILLPHRERNVMIGIAVCWGSPERFLGLLAETFGDPELAAQHFETAIARNDAGGIDSMYELVRRDYAALLERLGQPDRAAALRAARLSTPGATQ